MCDKKPMFAEAKKGDKVWSFTGGWCNIVDTDYSQAYPISTNHGHSYTLDGMILTTHWNPSLFWDEIKFEIPPRPKRKVKKVLHGWMNIYPPDTTRQGVLHSSQKLADLAAWPDRISCIEINQEYEVEE